MSDPVKDRIVTHDQGNDIIAKLQAIATALTNGFSNYLPLAGGTLTGTVNGVNPAATDNSAKLATTKYVKDNVPASVGSGIKPVYTDSNGKIVESSSTVGGSDTPVYLNGGTITAGGKIVPIQNNAGFHNSIFRGKNLGTSLTAAQSAAIQAGTFDDMFIGDYWVIGGYNWRIGMFDPWYNVGDTNFATHHLGIIPDTVLYSAKYNDTNTTEGGYVGSALYSGIGTARTTVKNAFGASHVPTHRILLPTTCTGGKYTSWAWRDEDIMLPTEVMVYGTRAWGDSGNNGYSVASQDCQWPLFALSPQHRHTRQTYWLQDVPSASGFANVGTVGNASNGNASNSFGVRPAFALI